MTIMATSPEGPVVVWNDEELIGDRLYMAELRLAGLGLQMAGQNPHAQPCGHWTGDPLATPEGFIASAVEAGADVVQSEPIVWESEPGVIY